MIFTTPGWVLRDNCFRIKWFDWDQIQDNAGRAIDESPEDEGLDDDYRYLSTSDKSDK